VEHDVESGESSQLARAISECIPEAMSWDAFGGGCNITLDAARRHECGRQRSRASVAEPVRRQRESTLQPAIEW
jgi:hypothetical protein